MKINVPSLPPKISSLSILTTAPKYSRNGGLPPFYNRIPKTGWIDISLSTADNDESNKENPPTKKKSQIETKTPLDASLAEELSAIREKLDRMRFDKDETAKMLRERDLALDMQMNQLLERGQIQRMLEIEVDRLYRLNQLRSSCLVMDLSGAHRMECVPWNHVFMA